MLKIQIPLFTSLVIAASSVYSQQSTPIDVLTWSCLKIDEPDPTVTACTRLHPSLKSQLEEARRKWEQRNAADFRAFREACQARLKQAYGGDAARIQLAKQQARDLQRTMEEALLREPNPDNHVNCRAYIVDYSTGNPRIDSLGEIVKETREGPARPFEWKK